MKINSMDVKKQNKKAIFRHLLHTRSATKPEIALALHLSVPTVGQIAGELIEAGLVREVGLQASNGGRRAVTLEVNTDKKLAFGVDITKNHVGFAVVNLEGRVLAHVRLPLRFEISGQYGGETRGLAKKFLNDHRIEVKKLIGLGVSLPGIVSKDGKSLAYSHILRLKEPLQFYGEDLSLPIRFFNDATAACMAECYTLEDPRNFTFLSLSNSVGGAVVNQNRVVCGNNGRSGELGHICVVPGGEPCYCGKRGHYDAYGSALVLARMAGGSLERFFERLEQGDPELEAAFDRYLDYLALLVSNIHFYSDEDVVIGGYVGSFLEPYLQRLREKTGTFRIFGEEIYVHLCRYKVEASAVGSALYFIDQFIDHL